MTKPYVSFLLIDGQSKLYPTGEGAIENVSQLRAVITESKELGNEIEIYISRTEEVQKANGGCPEIGLLFTAGKYDGWGLGPTEADPTNWMWGLLEELKPWDKKELEALDLYNLTNAVWGVLEAEIQKLPKSCRLAYYKAGEHFGALWRYGNIYVAGMFRCHGHGELDLLAKRAGEESWQELVSGVNADFGRDVDREVQKMLTGQTKPIMVELAEFKGVKLLGEDGNLDDDLALDFQNQLVDEMLPQNLDLNGPDTYIIEGNATDWPEMERAELDGAINWFTGQFVCDQQYYSEDKHSALTTLTSLLTRLQTEELMELERRVKAQIAEVEAILAKYKKS